MSAALGVNVRTSGTFVSRVASWAGRRGARDSCAEPETISRPAAIRQPGAALLRDAWPSLRAHDRRPDRPHQVPDAHRAEAEAGARGAPRPRPRPDRRHGAARPATAPTRRSRHDGRVTFRRTDDGAYERIARRRAATRSPTSRPTKFAPLADERAHPFPHRAENAYPLRLRPDRPALRRARPRPTSACSTPPRTTGRTRAATSASTARSGSSRRGRRSCSAGKGVRKLGLVPQSARLVDVAPTICALLGCAPLDDATATRTSRSRTARRSPTCSSPTSARATSSASCSTARTRTCSTTWPRAARRRTSRASSRWAPRSATARWRRCRPSRSRTTRRSSPARIPVTTASCNNAWFDRAAGEQVITNSSATWPWSMQHLVAGRRVDPRRGAPHVARRVHRVGQRAVRHRRRLLDLRLLPAGRGAADPEGPVRPARTRPSGSCARRRTTRGRRSSTTWASTRRSGILGGNYRDVELPDCRASCGATSRSPTPRCTKAGRTRRWRPRRCATATAASARSSTRSSSAGVFDDCAFVLVADHGMEENDPGVPRRLGRRAAGGAGIEARDEAYGFLYFGVRRRVASLRVRSRHGGSEHMRKLAVGVVVAALMLAACGGEQRQVELRPHGATSTTAQSSTTGTPAVRAATPISRRSPRNTRRRRSRSPTRRRATARLSRSRRTATASRRSSTGDSTIYTDGKTHGRVRRAPARPRSAPTRQPRCGAGAPTSGARSPATFAALATRSSTLGGGDKSSETIAGRDASCVTYKASRRHRQARSGRRCSRTARTPPDYDPNDTATICIDKETGFVAQAHGHEEGQGDDELVATAVGEPTDADFTPPCTPQTIAEHPGRHAPGHDPRPDRRLSSRLPRGTVRAAGPAAPPRRDRRRG